MTRPIYPPKPEPGHEPVFAGSLIGNLSLFFAGFFMAMAIGLILGH